ncbi:MAG TPA: DUF192 domain-containing protein [Caldilineaceae bacterium]|nr:DUF192 domain-containing protein [Caldilineaceae bacterium]
MLQVTNRTRGRRIVESGRVANNFWTRLVGLMGVRELLPGDGLLLTPANSIHTHFMRIPIDVLYVQPDGRVVDIDESLPPWRFSRIRKQARMVIELPAGAIAAMDIRVGDYLDIRY